MTDSVSAIPSMQCLVQRIISGGQTGADRAALDWALHHGVAHGGYCPKGRLAEDGPIAEHYGLQETDSDAYPVRTERNVLESDATVIFTIAPELRAGAKLTSELAEKHGKPWLHVWPLARRDLSIVAVRAFVADHGVASLNVAGSRASQEPSVGAFVHEVLTRALLG